MLSCGGSTTPIPYLQAYLVFLPWQRLLSILPVFFSFPGAQDHTLGLGLSSQAVS